MGIRKQKPKRTQSPASSPERPVSRELVAAARRRASQLNDIIESKEQNISGDDLVRRRQQEVQQKLAQLRSEAMQARRLAEQISNLSQEATTQKRRSVMSDTTTVHPDATQPLNRRASDKTRATGSQSRFNPLHPSMELPPEQLIRLLGLENKPSRKKRKTVGPKIVAADVPATSPVTVDRASPGSETELPKIEVPSDHRMYKKRQYRHADTSLFPQRRTNLVLAAGGVGIVAGIVVSASLFWQQPAVQYPQPAPVESPTAAPVTTQTPATAVHTQVSAQPVARQETAPAKSDAAPVDDPRWRAAVEAQEQRLRAAAERRLHERMQSGLPLAEPTTTMTPPESIEPTIQPAKTDEPGTASSDEWTDAVTAIPTVATQPAPPGEDVPPVPVGEVIAPAEQQSITAPVTTAAPEMTTDTPVTAAFEDGDSPPDNAETPASSDPTEDLPAATAVDTAGSTEVDDSP